MRCKNKKLGSKVSLKSKKVKPSNHTNVIASHLTNLLVCIRNYMTNSESPRLVKDFHANQLRIVSDALYFGETISSNAIGPSRNEIREANISLKDFPCKRIGAILQLNQGETEDFDDLEGICEEDKKRYKVCVFTALMTINDDHIQLKVAKGNPKGEWFFDAYYYRLPKNVIELFLNGEDMEIEVRLSYEKQIMPSDEYLINHCNRFLKFILDQIYKMKVVYKNEGDIYRSDVYLKNSEHHSFKIWQQPKIKDLG